MPKIQFDPSRPRPKPLSRVPLHDYSPKRTVTPSLGAIAWAAGFYEGEGYAGVKSSRNGSSGSNCFEVVVTQRDTECLEMLQ